MGKEVCIICKDCEFWQEGDGSRECLKCQKIDKAADNNKKSREVVLRSVDARDIRGAADYKEVLYDISKHIENKKKFDKMSRRDRAILALHVCGFKDGDIASIMSITRQRVNAILKRHRGEG